ncbi:MAG: flippase-like domain-containing protein [Deltaproteobacteria bacterium]|nr:flippase-like domain-containing protein [Deltaproteobacteria bacterium]
MKKFLIKISLSILTLSLVLWFTDTEALLQAFRESPPTAILVTAAGYALTLMVTSYKWFLLLRHAGVGHSLRNTLGATFAGAYVNCFGLGTLGGDLVRSVLAADDKRDRDKSLALVVFDRALGLAVLATIGIAFGMGQLLSSHLTGLIIVALLIVTGCVLLGYGAPRMASRFGSSQRPAIRRLGRILSVVPQDPKVLLAASLVALLYHFLQISLFWLVTIQIGAPVSLVTLLGIIPFVNIAGTLPLSWMGVGVREAVLASLTVPVLFSKEIAVLAGMIWSASVVFASAASGVVFVWYRNRMNVPVDEGVQSAHSGLRPGR